MLSHCACPLCAVVAQLVAERANCRCLTSWKVLTCRNYRVPTNPSAESLVHLLRNVNTILGSCLLAHQWRENTGSQICLAIVGCAVSSTIVDSAALLRFVSRSEELPASGPTLREVSALHSKPPLTKTCAVCRFRDSASFQYCRVARDDHAAAVAFCAGALPCGTSGRLATNSHISATAARTAAV